MHHDEEFILFLVGSAALERTFGVGVWEWHDHICIKDSSCNSVEEVLKWGSFREGEMSHIATVISKPVLRAGKYFSAVW